MDPISAELAEMAASLQFPEPDDPDNPNSNVTIPIDTLRKTRALLSGLINYLKIQYVKCASEKEKPEVAPTP